MDLSKNFQQFSFLKSYGKCDDDVIDRLSNHRTVMFLILCTIVASARQHVGSPIKCWFPQQFHKSWKQYGNNYCYIKNTYFVPRDEHIPETPMIRREAEIAYYQWVPYMLLCIAFMFYVPKAIWKLLNYRSGVNVTWLMNAACSSADTKKFSQRQAIFTELAECLSSSLARLRRDGLEQRSNNFLKRFLKHFCLGNDTQSPNYLLSLYLVIKLLYLLNIMLQFHIMNVFLHTSYSMYGIQILLDLLHGREWTQTGHFPRVTLCDFAIRDMGQNMQNHTVQCVLMINMFYEKIMIIIWFWYVAVFVATIISFTRWIVQSIFMRRHFIIQQMKFAKLRIDEESSHINYFIFNYLGCDGYFIIRLISLNAGTLVSREVVERLWMDFLEKQKLSDDEDDTNYMLL